jgi:hypothetical protein
VIIRATIATFSGINPFEAVNVKLSLKIFVLGVLEIPRHDGLFVQFGTVDSKGLPVWHPGNDGLVSPKWYVVQNFMEFEWKWQLYQMI